MILAYYTSVCLACWSWVALLAFRGACLAGCMDGWRSLHICRFVRLDWHNSRLNLSGVPFVTGI